MPSTVYRLPVHSEDFIKKLVDLGVLPKDSLIRKVTIVLDPTDVAVMHVEQLVDERLIEALR